MCATGSVSTWRRMGRCASGLLSYFGDIETAWRADAASLRAAARQDALSGSSPSAPPRPGRRHGP